MSVKKLNEGSTVGKQFPDDVVMYVNGDKIDVSGDFADAVYATCQEYSGLEDWIREYMNSLGDPIDPDGTMDLSEICYWFAREAEMDFDDSDDFYIDGSGIVDSDIDVEIFVEDGVEERMVRKVTPKRIKKEARMVNGRPRALSPQYDSRKSFYNKAHVVDDNDGNSTLYSYNTPVCRIVNGKVELLPKWDYSATTLRHVKDFLQQNGFEAGSKAQIAKKYSVVEESKSYRKLNKMNERIVDTDDEQDVQDEIISDLRYIMDDIFDELKEEINDLIGEVGLARRIDDEKAYYGIDNAKQSLNNVSTYLSYVRSAIR